MLMPLTKAGDTDRFGGKHCPSPRTSSGRPLAFVSVWPGTMNIRQCLLCLFIICAPSLVMAATLSLPGMSAKKSGVQKPAQAAAVLTDASIEESRVKLETRLTELRLQLGSEAVAEMQKNYADVASSQELVEWETLMNRLIGILEDHVSSLLRFKNLRTATRDRTTEVKGWQGFTEKPPYPFSLVESIRDAIDGNRSNLNLQEVMRTTAEGELAEFSSNIKESGKQLRLAEEALEMNTGKPDELRKRWLVALARLRDQVNQAGALLAELRQSYYREALGATQAEIDFLRRKLAAARGNYRFTVEELEQKIQAIDKRQQTLSRELEQAYPEMDVARKQLEKSEAAMRKAESDFSRPSSNMQQLGRILKEHEVRQTVFDAADFRVQILKGMMHVLRSEKAIWFERYRLSSGLGAEPEPTDTGSSRKNLELIGIWKGYVDSKISSLESLIRSNQEKLANATLDRYERDAARSKLAVYQGQEVLLRRGVELLSEFERLEQRRNEEAKSTAEKVSRWSAQNALAMASTQARKIWNTELYVAEETIIAEGKTIVRPRSVTIGKLVQALLILLAGTWVLGRLKRPLRWFAINRLRFDESKALLYTRLLTYLMFIVLLVCSLIFVNIPLAIFAFFGGALAIGIGFGAQNLINNFISGLILMFDRTIRLGDVVELDIHRGRVTAIGMRNSRVKRFDGVEMLVPNSQFLQQNVINWTLSDRRVRYAVTVGVAYGSATRETAQVILKAVVAQPEVLTDPPAYVTFDNFAESSLNFSAYFWLEMDPAMNSLEICSDIRHRIGEMLGKAGISIPFPQRDLHLSASRPLEVIVSGPGS